MPTPTDLLRRALTADPARPAVTSYDSATGERVELSVATLDNWVAKTANLLVDGLASASGGTVGVRLPCHWLASVWLIAAWSAGQTALLDDAAYGADVLVVGPDDVARADASAAGEVLAVSLLPLGRPFARALPGRVLDYAVEVPAYGDRFVPSVPARPDDPALLSGGATWTLGRLAEEADARAAELGVGPADRVLTARAANDAGSVVDLALLPLLTGGVVLARHADDAALAPVVAQERVRVAIDAAGVSRPV